MHNNKHYSTLQWSFKCIKTEAQNPTKPDQPDNTNDDSAGPTVPPNGETPPKDDPEKPNEVTAGKKSENGYTYHFEN